MILPLGGRGPGFDSRRCPFYIVNIYISKLYIFTVRDVKIDGKIQYNWLIPKLFSNLFDNPDLKFETQFDKNILKEDEFNNKANTLREKYKSYKELKINKNNDLKKLRDKSANQILKIINEILTVYSTNNKISLIIEKKNVVIGKTDLDITKNVLELLNSKIKKVELK